MSSSVHVVIGIDIAKERCEVAVLPSEEHGSYVTRTPEFSALVERCQRIHPEVIVCEATGGYEMVVVGALAAAGRPIVVVNPRQVRDFAKATGQRAKTDRIDAQMIAQFALAVHLAVRPLPEAAAQELKAALARHHQLVEMLVAERNRLDLATGRVREDIQAHVVWLKQRVHDTDQRLREELEHSPVWRARDKLLQSIPGIGPDTSASCLAPLPELGRLNRRELASGWALRPSIVIAGPSRVTARPGVAGPACDVRCTWLP